jgi:hypothetical protein
MPARLAAALTTLAVLALPAAAHATHVVVHAPHGPSATPLIVELIAVALVGLGLVTRKPLTRSIRAATARVGARRAHRTAPRTSPHTAGE